MALVIRLRPQGRKNDRKFRIVVADKQSPLKGKYVAMLGWYDPRAKQYEIDVAQVQTWLKKGAKMSDTVSDMVKKKAQVA